LKLKAEDSGYSGSVHSPEADDRYVDSFWQSEGIRQDKEAIRYYTAKRSLAKLFLNSMWGKLTERNNGTMKKIITVQKDLYGFVATPGVDVTNLAFAGDDVIYISWKRGAEKDVPNLPHTKKVIGG